MASGETALQATDIHAVIQEETRCSLPDEVRCVSFTAGWIHKTYQDSCFADGNAKSPYFA
jgi:hypothetical protein